MIDVIQFRTAHVQDWRAPTLRRLIVWERWRASCAPGSLGHLSERRRIRCQTTPSVCSAHSNSARAPTPVQPCGNWSVLAIRHYPVPARRAVVTQVAARADHRAVNRAVEPVRPDCGHDGRLLGARRERVRLEEVGHACRLRDERVRRLVHVAQCIRSPL
jgi:hypothetical protein